MEAETLAQAGTGVDFGVGDARGADPFAVEITHVKFVRLAATRLATEIFAYHYSPHLRFVRSCFRRRVRPVVAGRIRRPDSVAR